uniref:Endonuclease n=1 Tax=viral metagenome TaxID=1070528 RepID=A0A6C0B041_9ZZZZ
MPTLCSHLNCKKRANYGNEIKKNIFCAEHKTDDMFISWSRICEVDGCKLFPIFNFDGEKNGRYCLKHKLDEMIDVFHKKCEIKGCKITSYFNFKNEKKGRFCFIHKLDGMIDIKSKRCIFKDCNIKPCFNFKGEKPNFCVNHKLDGMLNVKQRKSCIFSNCEKIPRFNYEKEKIPIFCLNHKLEGMINLWSNLCKNDGCLIKGNKKYKNYCTHCFQYLFPLDPLTFQIRCKTKEIAVRDFLNANYEGFNHDKILEYGGCDCLTRRRIDHRKLIDNTLLCIETDENQHKSYSKEYEEARYNDLIVNFTCKYIIIRFNPDSYINKKGFRINPYISTKLHQLKCKIDEQIERIKNNENSELLEIIYLYYDNYN